jgi:hypothetical protein
MGKAPIPVTPVPAIPSAALTPVPSTGILTTADTIVHQAANVEAMAMTFISVFFPQFALYQPEIIALLNAFAQILDKATGVTTPPGGQPPLTP